MFISFYIKLHSIKGICALNNHVLCRLIDQKIENIEITVDGLKEFHDKTRFKKTGSGSYEKIMRNLILAIEHLKINNIKNVNITVRYNVNKFNMDGVIPFLNYLKEKELHDNITFYISPVHSWGNDAHLNSLSNIDFSEFEIYIMSEMQKMGFAIGWLPKQPKNATCIATSQDDEVIDTYGNIHKCSETPYVKAYGDSNSLLEELKIYQTEFDETFENWYSILKSEKYPCTNCPILPICGGSCPKLWQEGIAACPSIKFNLTDRIINNYLGKIDRSIL